MVLICTILGWATIHKDLEELSEISPSDGGGRPLEL